MYRIQYGNNDIEDQLDTNPDLRIARNGVIDLKTGACREGLPEDYMTTQLDTDYNGLGSSTKDIDEFMEDIFDNNSELIEYVQRLLGYGITGHTTEQCWLIPTGSGGNGKSLLIGLLEKLLEKWYVTAPYDVFFKSARRAQAGGPSPHLEELKGARICDYETFTPTALPILLCNHKPAVDVDDPAMLRRIKVIPFNNIYTSPEDSIRPYDRNNPRHRLRDPNVRQRLHTKYSQEQLLVWLVEGAVKWYAGGLGKLPQCMKDAFQECCSENDKLKEFIDECCEVSDNYKVNAKLFRDSFRSFLGYSSNVQQKDLMEMMNTRGFQYKAVRDGTSVTKMYLGLQVSVQFIRGV
ncbi:hypothetical protein BGX26_006796 [Mortierella sp. AD094]|nr:hypothetical protein BGX26_006796 [Mortierella sp. AD094]